MYSNLSRAMCVAVCLGGFSSWAQEVSLAPWAKGESRGEDLVIWLVTFGPGDIVPAWFGHSALVVQDERLRHGRLYNYGMFSFDSTMLMRFAKGRLTFWVGEASIRSTLQAYKEEGREVRIQELNLSPSQRLQMAKALADQVKPENREYLYHHYNDNCSTRPRDLIDRLVGGRLSVADQATARMTLRDHTRRHAFSNPAMSVLLDFAMNDEIDRPITRWEEAFLPAELETQLAALKTVNESGQEMPLVKTSWVEAQGSLPQVPTHPPKLDRVLWGVGMTLGLLGFVLGKKARTSRGGRLSFGFYNMFLGVVPGLPGLLLAIMWAWTDHTVTYRNENLFFAHPLTFLALPMGIWFLVGSEKAFVGLKYIWLGSAVVAGLGVMLKVFPVFNQDNFRIIGLLLPINLGMGLGLALSGREKSSRG